MQKKTRSSLRIGASLAVLVACLGGLVGLVSSGSPSPRLTVDPPPAAVDDQAPVVTNAILQSETRNAVSLQAAFDRIGFDLNAVAHGYISVPRVLLASLPSDIEQLDALTDRKILFVRALLPVVLHVNDQIAIDRQRLLRIREKMNAGATLAAEDVRMVLSLADAYDQPDADIDALLQKVDVIPPSMAMAQAIVESGWGTSRIARQHNALFGQFAPSGDGSDWDYRSFPSLTEAMASYARNLNTHRAYRDFRSARAVMRASRGGLDGYALIGTLRRYSQLGSGYVDALRSLIKANSLDVLDQARLNRLNITTIVASN
jgi:Bax protein